MDGRRDQSETDGVYLLRVGFPSEGMKMSVIGSWRWPHHVVSVLRYH